MPIRIHLAILIDGAAAAALAGAVAFATYATGNAQASIAAASAVAAGFASFAALRQVDRTPVFIGLPSTAVDDVLPELLLEGIAEELGSPEFGSSVYQLPDPEEMQKRIDRHLARSSTAPDTGAADELRDALSELRRAIR